jgi:hypothetical protein
MYPIQWCVSEGNSQNGIRLLQSFCTISNSKLWKNEAMGLYCVGSSSSPGVDHTKIEQNEVGVASVYGACPILGDIDLELGQNNSIYNQPTYVYGSPSYGIMAQNCWWGTENNEPPNPNKFKGIVVWSPYLPSDPVPYLAPRAPSVPTVLSLGQNYPNPVVGSASTRITYSIPSLDFHGPESGRPGGPCCTGSPCLEPLIRMLSLGISSTDRDRNVDPSTGRHLAAVDNRHPILP